MKKYLIVSLILGLFTACSGFISDDEDYTFTDYFEPLRYDKENGGYMIAGNGNTKFTIFDFTLSDTKNSKEQIVKAKEPLVSYWKIGRNPLGMEPDYSKCDKEPRYEFNMDRLKEQINRDHEEYLRVKDDVKLYTEYKKRKEEEARLRDIEYEVQDKYKACRKRIKETFDSQTTYKYYFAKMPENHLVHYPKKSELHFRWNISNYIGGVNDLKLKSVPEIYQNSLDKLRT